MGSGGVAIAALPTVICLKVPFSDGLGGVFCFFSCFDDNSPYFVDLYPCYIELNCYLCNRSLANICYYINFKYQYY